MGCGACASLLGADVVRMVDDASIGARPVLRRRLTPVEARDSLAVCPGIEVPPPTEPASAHLVVPDAVAGYFRRVWVGYAADSQVRFAGSSGGLLTALSQFCLESGRTDYLVHTGMSEAVPWKNTTVESHDARGIVDHAGSRYAPSSPCTSFRAIEEDTRTALFVGKPCDVAAFRRYCVQRPALSSRVYATLSFFCAGTPTSGSVRSVVSESLGERINDVTSVRFRGDGWPGSLRVTLRSSAPESLLSYDDAWSILQSSRGMRCHLCADGMGELADVACGDAWHRYADDGNNGLSVVVARTQLGERLVLAAREAGYVVLEDGTAADIRDSQGTSSGIAMRRRQILGRSFGVALVGLNAPRFRGFPLRQAWRELSLLKRIKVVLGTARRAMSKGWIHRETVRSKKQ